ncbi:MAG: DUF1972 domain-containing protein, partial [Candidatus Bathyarchaeia archaeon]
MNPDGLEWARTKFAWPTRSLLMVTERIGVKLSNSVVSESRAIGDYFAARYNVHCEYIPYPCSKQPFTDTGILEKMN